MLWVHKFLDKLSLIFIGKIQCLWCKKLYDPIARMPNEYSHSLCSKECEDDIKINHPKEWNIIVERLEFIRKKKEMERR